jgi:hypothetical protein
MIFGLLLSTCRTKKTEFRRNDNLLDFKSTTAFEIDELIESGEQLLDAIYSDKFVAMTDTIIFKDGMIYISYLSIVNDCGNYAGDIEIKSDSIILQLIDTVGLSCTGQRCDRLIFKIKNSENRKYKIKKW